MRRGRSSVQHRAVFVIAHNRLCIDAKPGFLLIAPLRHPERPRDAISRGALSLARAREQHRVLSSSAGYNTRFRDIGSRPRRARGGPRLATFERTRVPFPSLPPDAAYRGRARRTLHPRARCTDVRERKSSRFSRRRPFCSPVKGQRRGEGACDRVHARQKIDARRERKSFYSLSR